MAHIRYHEDFAAIKGFPGYFWNLKEKKLYSIKVGGTLKAIKESKVNKYSAKAIGFERIGFIYYSISHRGRRHCLLKCSIESRLIYEDTIDK